MSDFIIFSLLLGAAVNVYLTYRLHQVHHTLDRAMALIEAQDAVIETLDKTDKP